jgi:hypothetical protein
MNKVEIQIPEPESIQTRLESRFDTLGPMIGVPQLCGDKDLFTRNPSSSKSYLQSLAHLTLVPVSLRAIEVSKSGFQCVSGCSYCYGCVRNQGAKAECGHRTAPVVERHFRQPKIRRFSHGNTSALFCILHRRPNLKI